MLGVKSGHNPDPCEIAHCRNTWQLIYYGHKICWHHWLMHCNGLINLKEVFKIPQEKKRLQNWF